MNNIKFILDKRVYNLEAILNTCYAFIDRVYIYLDSDSKGEKIMVQLKGKQKLSIKTKEQIKDEFMNELLHNSLRCMVSKNNKKIREYIIGRALYGPSLDLMTDNAEIDITEFDYKKEDPLGIAVPWKEKYSKKKKSVKVSKV